MGQGSAGAGRGRGGDGRPVVLFVSHRERACGVHEFGCRVFRALAPSPRYRFVYREVASALQYHAALRESAPALVVVNHHPATMPWLRPHVRAAHAVPHVGVLHEADQRVADAAPLGVFDALVVPDPTLVPAHSRVFRTGRVVFPWTGARAEPDVPTIGSFGFGFPNKGFERLVRRVAEEWPRAVVRLHVPRSGMCDPDGSLWHETVARARAAAAHTGIQVQVTSGVLDEDGLCRFLAGNHLNAFLYDPMEGRGVASTPDHALAVGRPVAVSGSAMFRHLHGVTPSLVAEHRSLRAILAGGTAPLAPLVAAWSPERLRGEWEAIVDAVLAAGPVARPAAVVIPALPPGGRNRILDDAARAALAPCEALLRELVPEAMARKLPRANVQQAFVLGAVLEALAGRRAARILCVGAFEDTACMALQELGHAVDEVDPLLNTDLEGFVAAHAERIGGYDVVFSTSVLEHVPDDTGFLRRIAELLAPAGVAVLTCDFQDAWRPGRPLPTSDVRLYTRDDLRRRVLAALLPARPVDEPRWHEGREDFEFERVRYAFATLVVQR